MRLPTSIRIGFRDYRVETWPMLHATSADRYGECDRTNGVIRIMDGLPPLETAQVLVHEVLHAMFDAGCLQDTDGEERIVSVLSNVWMQVWRDNPSFRECLMLAL